MKTLQKETAEMIDRELRSIPEKYWKNFNSNHEGYAILLEEVRELENEIFFGEKKIKEGIHKLLEHPDDEDVERFHKFRIREEAVQIAAMAVRIIQELT